MMKLHGDVGEIGERVVAEIWGGGGREYVRPVSTDHQCVAVRIRARDLGRADHAASTGSVLYVELLLETLRELFGDQASHAIGGAGRREWHYDLDRPVGPFLRVDGMAYNHDKRGKRAADQLQPGHISSAQCQSASTRACVTGR